jgi:glutathione synthase/RimK-type ligase-like ATP-grasp enzyme
LIVIISYPDEEHTQKVIGKLNAAGRDSVMIDLSEFPARRGFSQRWSPPGDMAIEMDHDGRRLDLANASVVWWRRVRGFELEPELRRPQDRAFAESETSQAVLGLLDSLSCSWVNPRGADEAAHRKPLQWSVALSCGFLLPKTLVTTKADDARAFLSSLGGRKAVFKAFLASIEDWRETRIVEAEDIERLDAVRYAPVIFQEYIEGVDLRVMVIGDQVFAAEIDARDTSYPFDMRMVVGEAIVKPVQLPSDVEAALLAVHRKLGIVYGASDLRRTAAGEHYFLEVNPAGQWLFVEDRTGLQITAAMAGHLAKASDLQTGRK